MLLREFVNNAGQKVIVRENEDGTLDIGFVPFSMRVKSWAYIDDLKTKGQLHYCQQYDLVNMRY